MPKIYYKATRPDGTDFRTGTVDYVAALRSGRPLKRLTNPDGWYECCTGTVYHASDTPSETLIGGSFPCRLFEVTGRPVASEDRKFGFRSLRVVREVPAWQALGPNGQQVERLIRRASRLTSEDARRLYAARGAVQDAVRYAAWDAVRYAARDAVRYAAWGAAWDATRVAAWDAARDAAWDAVQDAARYAARSSARSSARYAAWGAAQEAARDAAVAIVFRDLITDEQFELLAGPWVSVMGDVR